MKQLWEKKPEEIDDPILRDIAKHFDGQRPDDLQKIMASRRSNAIRTHKNMKEKAHEGEPVDEDGNPIRHKFTPYTHSREYHEDFFKRMFKTYKDFGSYKMEYFDYLIEAYMRDEYKQEVKSKDDLKKQYKKQITWAKNRMVGSSDEKVERLQKEVDKLENEKFALEHDGYDEFDFAFADDPELDMTDENSNIDKIKFFENTDFYKKVKAGNLYGALNDPQFVAWARSKKSYLKGIWTKMHNEYLKNARKEQAVDLEYAYKNHIKDLQVIPTNYEENEKPFWFGIYKRDLINELATDHNKEYNCVATINRWIDPMEFHKQDWFDISVPADELFPYFEMFGEKCLALIPVKTERSKRIEKLCKRYNATTNKYDREDIRNAYLKLERSTDPELDEETKEPDSNVLKRTTGEYSWTHNSDYHNNLFMASISHDNFAVRCGQYSNLGRLVCLDFDSKDHKTPPLTDHQLNYILKHYFNNSSMMWQRTKNNGIHIFMIVPDKSLLTRNNGSKQCLITVDEHGNTIGCDVRTDNGYVVVSGKGYGNIHVNIRADVLFEAMRSSLADSDYDRMIALDKDYKPEERWIDTRVLFKFFDKNFYNTDPDRAVFRRAKSLKFIKSHWQLVFRHLFRNNRVYQLCEIPVLKMDKLANINMTAGQLKKTINNHHVKSKMDKLIVADRVNHCNKKDIASPQIDREDLVFNENYTEGCRNTIVFTLSCWLRLNNWDKEDVLDFVTELNESSNEPLSDSEVYKTVSSVFKKNEDELYGVDPDAFEQVNDALSNNSDPVPSAFELNMFHANDKETFKPVARSIRKNSHYDETCTDFMAMLSGLTVKGPSIQFDKVYTFEELTEKHNRYLASHGLLQKRLSEGTLMKKDRLYMTKSSTKKMFKYLFYNFDGTEISTTYDKDLALRSIYRFAQIKRGYSMQYQKKEKDHEIMVVNAFLNKLPGESVKKHNLYKTTESSKFIFENEKMRKYLCLSNFLFLLSVGIERKRGVGVKFFMRDEELFKVAKALRKAKTEDAITQVVNRLSLSDDDHRPNLRMTAHNLFIENIDMNSTDKTNNHKEGNIISLNDYKGDHPVPIVLCPVGLYQI